MIPMIIEYYVGLSRVRLNCAIIQEYVHLRPEPLNQKKHWLLETPWRSKPIQIEAKNTGDAQIQAEEIITKYLKKCFLHKDKSKKAKGER